MATELRISDQKMDRTFVDDWDLERIRAPPRYDPREIRTITLDNVKFDNDVYYDLFQDLVNVREFNIFNSHLNSKILYNLLTVINPHSLHKLDLSYLVFDSFDGNDVIHLNSLFSVELILAESMTVESQHILANILSHGIYRVTIDFSEIKEPEESIAFKR